MPVSHRDHTLLILRLSNHSSVLWKPSIQKIDNCTPPIGYSYIQAIVGVIPFQILTTTT